MMPTFPSPPLKFRTVGFPQYGFKASMSDKACRPRGPVKRVPRIPRSTNTFALPFAHGEHRTTHLAQRPGQVGSVEGRCVRGTSLSTPGVLGSGRSYVVSSPPRLLRPHPSVSQARGDFTIIAGLYAAPSLCGHAEAAHETFPTFTAVLSTRAVDPTPVGPNRPPVTRRPDARLPQLRRKSPPTKCPSLPAILDGETFSALHRSRYAAARVFASPSGLATTRCGHVPRTGPAEDFVTLAWAGGCRHLPVRVRLDGRTGNLPSSGLAPDKLQQLVRLHAKPPSRENEAGRAPPSARPAASAR